MHCKKLFQIWYCMHTFTGINFYIGLMGYTNSYIEHLITSLIFVMCFVISWQQIVLMAISFIILKLFLPVENLILIWMLPGILATLQLFYFGTYLPHRGAHRAENVHKSHSQKPNHLWAFLSCYFFGYHYEHHASPGTPWWQLYKTKEKYQEKGYPHEA